MVPSMETAILSRTHRIGRGLSSVGTGLREKPADTQFFVAMFVSNWGPVANYVCVRALQTLASRKGQSHATRIVVPERNRTV
jgi:hypothetical protein